MRILTHALLAAALSAPVALSAAQAADYSQGENPWLGKTLTREALLDPVRRAADFFVRNTLEDGSFDYIKDPLGKCCRKKPEKYSLIRHLGGVYALLRAYELTKDERYLDAAHKGIEFVARFREPTKDGALAVRSLKGDFEIGDNGFMLIDTVLFDQLAPQKLYASMNDDLAKFLKSALVYNGPYSTSGQWAECQAIIGLSHYYQHENKDPEIIRTTSRWLGAMMADNKSSHWSAQAIRWALEVNPNLDPALITYGVDKGKELLGSVRAREGASMSRLVGSRNDKINSCNATARNEGLISTYVLARHLKREDEASALLDRIKEHIAYAMQFQYGQPGNFYENDPMMTRMGRLFDLDGGVFDTPKQGVIRVDYVSHHVRAMAAYLALPNVPVEPGLKMQDIAH
jgi:hypothetical protein